MEEQVLFRSSILSIIDNTLRLTWIAGLVIFTNFAIIVKKINEFNLNININLLLIIFFLTFICAVFIYNLISWKISRFKITSNMLVIYKNIVIKDRKEFLISEISNICVSRNLFEIFFKLKRIKIYENEKNKLRFNFDIVVNKSTFDKKFLPLFKKCDIDISNLDEQKVIKFNFIQVLKHSILSIPVSSIIVIINIILLVVSMISKGTFINRTLYDLLGLIVTIIGFLFPIIYSISKNVIKYFNFKIIRKNDSIYISYGLLKKINYIISASKINGIIIDVSILSKLSMCYKINVILTGIGDKKNKLEMLFPITKKNKCIKILREILPEYSLDMRYKRQPYESFVIIALKIMLVMIILVIPLICINVMLAMYLSFFLMLSTFFIYFVKRIIISESNILIVNGIFIKKIVALNYSSIDSIVIKEGIISKRLGLCRVYINIFSDIKNSKHAIGYIKKEKLLKIKYGVLNN